MMTAAVEWSALTLAGAFIVGAVLGTAATIRVCRIVMDYLKDRGPGKPPK